MAKTILLFAYHFPPIGGPTTERSLSLVRYLPAFGYEPIVLTWEAAYDFWSPRDSTGEKRLPSGLHVERASLAVASARRARIERLLALPSTLGRRFAVEASRAAAKLERSVDLMMCLFGPYELGRAAIRVARELDVPWVADLQDPWALDEMWLYPTAFHRSVDRRRMKGVLHDASAVIMNTPEAANRVRSAFPALDPARMFAIPNGFNGDEFPLGEAVRTEVFRIVHTGSMHTQIGLRHRRTMRRRRLLGGMPVPGIDFLTRSHVFLLEAVDRLLRDDPSLSEMLEVHLVGPLTEADRAVADHSPVVRMHGFLPHDETTQMIRTADLLFLPMHDLPPAVRAGLVPTKTYEYAASRRPILAAVPEGDARDLLRELGTATIVEPADAVGMQSAIADSYSRWRRGLEPPRVNEELLSRFEYRQIVRRIAEVLDAVAS